MDDKQLKELIDSINNLNTSVEDFHKYVQDKDEAEAEALAESKAESSKQQEAEKKAEAEQLEKETKFNEESLKKLESILQENKLINERASESTSSDDFASLGDVLSDINSKVGNIDNQVTNPMGQTLQADDGSIVSTSFYQVSYIADVVLLAVFFFILTPYILYRLFIKPFMDVI